MQGVGSLPETPGWKGAASGSHGAADPTLFSVCGIRQDTLQKAVPPLLLVFWRRV